MVKESLANFRSDTILVRIKGVIFLDPPTFQTSAEWCQYRTDMMRTLKATQFDEGLQFSSLKSLEDNFQQLLTDSQVKFKPRYIRKVHQHGIPEVLNTQGIDKPPAKHKLRALSRRIKGKASFSFISRSSSRNASSFEILCLPLATEDVKTHAIQAVESIMHKNEVTERRTPSPLSRHKLSAAEPEAQPVHTQTPRQVSSSDFYPNSVEPSEDADGDGSTQYNLLQSPRGITQEREEKAGIKRTLTSQTGQKRLSRSDTEVQSTLVASSIANDETPVVQDKARKDKSLDIRLLQFKSYLGALHHQSGEFEQARYQYESVEEALSTSDNVYGSDDNTEHTLWRIRNQRKLAVLSLHQGDCSTAERILETLINRNRGDSSKFHQEASEAERWYANCLYRRGIYAEAQKILERILHKAEYAESELSSRISIMLTKNLLALVLAHRTELSNAVEHNNKALVEAQKLQAVFSSLKDEIEVKKQEQRLGLIYLSKATISILAGTYHDARTAAGQASEIGESALGSDHPFTLECQVLNARLLVKDGKFSDAEAKCEQILEELRKDLGDSHPLTLEALGVLVSALTSLARLTEARSTAKYLILKSERILGPNHPQTLQSINEFVRALEARGELLEAVKYQKDLIHRAICCFGSKHPTLTAYKITLSTIYCSLGDWEKAKFEACDVLQFYMSEAPGPGVSDILRTIDYAKEKVGKLHPSTFLAFQLIGVSVREQSQDTKSLESAHQILHYACTSIEQQLPYEHPDAINALLQLGITSRKLNQLPEAIEDLEEVLNARVKMFNDFHPETLIAREQLSFTRILLQSQPKYLEELRQVIELQVMFLGWSHPSTIETCSHLSTACERCGRVTEAISFRLIVVAALLQLYRLVPTSIRRPAEPSLTHAVSAIKTFSNSVLESSKKAKVLSLTFKNSSPDIHGALTRIRTNVEQLISLYEKDGNLEEARRFKGLFSNENEYSSAPDVVTASGALPDDTIQESYDAPSVDLDDMYSGSNGITSPPDGRR